MNEESKTSGEQMRGEDALRNVVEWSEEGPGQHNFLRIIADDISPEVSDLLDQHGYTLVNFDDLSTQEERARLEELLVNSQSHMNKINPKKVAVIVSKGGKAEAMQDESLQRNWSLNSQYMETFFL